MLEMTGKFENVNLRNVLSTLSNLQGLLEKKYKYMHIVLDSVFELVALLQRYVNNFVIITACRVALLLFLFNLIYDLFIIFLNKSLLINVLPRQKVVGEETMFAAKVPKLEIVALASRNSIE
uniref:Uncharacterized protein n=1 Tax=Glossina pallidipes TaxID=7398 RepID=A0A1B0A0S8_GLOPL